MKNREHLSKSFFSLIIIRLLWCISLLVMALAFHNFLTRAAGPVIDFMLVIYLISWSMGSSYTGFYLSFPRYQKYSPKIYSIFFWLFFVNTSIVFFVLRHAIFPLKNMVFMVAPA